MAHKGTKKWHDHAEKTKGASFHTPTQERLLAWADKHKNDPGSDKAKQDLRAYGFDPEHPPA